MLRFVGVSGGEEKKKGRKKRLLLIGVDGEKEEVG